MQFYRWWTLAYLGFPRLLDLKFQHITQFSVHGNQSGNCDKPLFPEVCSWGKDFHSHGKQEKPRKKIAKSKSDLWQTRCCIKMKAINLNEKHIDTKQKLVKLITGWKLHGKYSIPWEQYSAYWNRERSVKFQLTFQPQTCSSKITWW